MWNPVKIEFENLFAHKHSAYEFKNNECVVIFGRNATDRNLDNNGAGKTTLFEAICLALTNDSMRPIKKETFINDSADQCSIRFELYNAVLRMKLVINRMFYRGNKPVKVEIYENDKLNTQITCVNDANKRVLELLGISREDLLRYFIISQDNQYTFFTASDAEKKEIMNRITSADAINPATEKLQKRWVSVDGKISELTEAINTLETRKETLEEQLEVAKSSSAKDESIRMAQERIEELNQLIEEKQATRKRYEERLEELKAEEKKLPKKPDLSELRTMSKDLRANAEEQQQKRTKLKRELASIERDLDGKVKCPDCGSEFIPKSETGMTFAQAKKRKGEIDKSLENIDKEIKEIDKLVDEVSHSLDESEEILSKWSDLEDRQAKGSRLVKGIDDDIEDAKKRIKGRQAEIERLKKEKKNDTAVVDLKNKIKNIEGDLKAKRAEIEPLQQQLDMIDFWRFNMSRSGFMTYLANRSIKIIEGVTNSYLRKFGVDISVLINGFKVLKTGEVREKIDVFVTNDGINVRAFMGESGGERGRVTLAGVLGIQHLINMSTNGRGLNLLLMDECFHGMDSRGQENIIKIFEKMGSTILVITQNVSESFNNENTLFVVKENGESRYIS